MISRDLHASPQAALWKKLRLIKKCCFCRNIHEKQLLSQEILARHQTLSLISSEKIELTTINLYIKVKTKKQTKSNEQSTQTNETLPQFSEKYYPSNKSKQQLGNMIFYFRYLEQKPTLLAPQMFNIMVDYRSKKKMYEYCRIKTMYSPQKSTKGSIKLRKKVNLTEQFLNFIEESRVDISNLSFKDNFKDKNQVTYRKGFRNVEEEGNQCQKSHKKTSSKKNTWLKLQTHKLLETRKKRSVDKVKKHHKSCDNILGEYKHQSLKKEEKKMKGSKEQQNIRNFRLCISKIKDEIRHEKHLLRQKDSTHRMRQLKVKEKGIVVKKEMKKSKKEQKK